MAITLGTIELSDELVLLGLENSPAVAMSARRTLGGAIIAQVRPLSGGRSLSLQSEKHLSTADVAAVKMLEAKGLPIQLVHHRGTFTVRVTGIEVEPDEDFADVPNALHLWWSGHIHLLEV